MPVTPSVVTLLAQAVDALGTFTFYDRLLDLIGPVARHDLAALVRYSRSSPPDLILPRVEPTQPMRDYSRQFYVLDPFYQHWAGGGGTGVFRLRGMVPTLGRSPYAREFLTAMSIYDEIAIFLPPIGEASPTLILDRAEGNFTAAETQRCRDLYPVLASLHRAHVDRFVMGGLDHRASPFGSDRPLRLMDQSGVQIFATAGWDQALAEPAFAQALADLEARGPCTLNLPGGRIIRRTAMPPDFGAAPNGLCDDVLPNPESRPAAQNLGAGLPEAIAKHLTEREREVVMLTLQGHPASGIARRMRVSPGTVRNHRLNIYRKLDITTERELFLAYLAAVGGIGG